MLARPAQLISPEQTIAQARAINAIRRTHMIIGYEGMIDDDGTYIIVTTNLKDFAIREDGTILGTNVPLPPSAARRRRRSLRNPAAITEESNDAHQ